MKTINQFHAYLRPLNTVSNYAKIGFGIAALGLIALTSCSANDDSNDLNHGPGFDIPSAQDFANVRSQALNNITQNFQFNADDGMISLTSDNGVAITINAGCLTKNGNPVTGMVDLEYVEIFERGNMLTTNKPTMGLMANGGKKLIITGGEFFFEATQGDVILETNCALQIVAPSALTGGFDPDMILWTGVIDADGDLTWEEQANPTGQGGVFPDNNNDYLAFIQNFGWTNIDRFYNDPRPKTTIYAQAPVGYNYTNSAIYVSFDGEASGLATLDTYANGLFSEHYGEIPVGLECHLIFTSEVEGVWRYAIKPYTIVANQIITFTMMETAIASEADLIDMVNNLP
ncbi:hypothetical protein [Bizionia myxarmorum]|uniref:Uncharacterized protein n=1 Tax=Bizionia myxarmorum TaxID=291186 RepID=A0A5D0RC30_9FLAO|nr:hypothetical protein [Bizionia myxarmorum]TYB78466.1 hypothetical protein ES674_01410 [Bizionia myxarmorum]